jgi:phage repressor protein C with HTH and peptisase S24 domain
MTMDKKERFNKAYEYLRFEGVIKTQADAAKAMNAGRPNISLALKGDKAFLTDKFLTRFAGTFKQISLNWLLYEEGPMTTVSVPEFKSENLPQVIEGDVDKDIVEEQKKMTARIMELMRETSHIAKTFALQADIELSLFQSKMKGEKVWSVADVHKICDTFKVRKSWLVDGEGQKYRLPEEVLETIPARRSYDVHVGVPYYNVDFRLGFDLMVNSQTVNPDYMIDFEPYNNCDCWCNARGDSMAPTIANGDVIALKEVMDPKSCLINDEIYAIVTTNDLRTIKRIKDNGDTVTLIPDNKDYSEQTIGKDMLFKVYRVMGSLKMF